MTRSRLVAAAAAILTLLLLQATLVAPVVATLSSAAVVSLPAVAVASVAFVDGPATGMSFGFVAGLLADLGSAHPAGVLALCWLGVGLLCGRVADQHTLRHDAISAGLICAVAGSVATVALAVLNAGGSLSGAAAGFLPSAIGDVLLSFAVLALVRRMLGSDTLRRPHAVLTDLATSVRRG